jgi:hypothetical protein
MPTLPEHARARFQSCFFLSIPLHKSPKRLRTSMNAKPPKWTALARASTALFTITPAPRQDGRRPRGDREKP